MLVLLGTREKHQNIQSIYYVVLAGILKRDPNEHVIIVLLVSMREHGVG